MSHIVWYMIVLDKQYLLNCSPETAPDGQIVMQRKLGLI